MDQPRLWSRADPLGEALHFLRMSGAFYCRSELTAPWGLTMPAMPGCLWFHVVTAGRCVLQGEGYGPITLTPGDFALVPHGRGHVLRTSPKVATPVVLDVPHEMVSDHYALLRFGGGGAPTTLVCGVVRFDHPAAEDLVALLPPAIQLGAADADGEWMQSTLRLMALEAKQLRPGGETVITRLADVLVIQAIRSWLDGDGAARAGWLGALRDPQIGRALALVTREPSRPWSVAALAAEVAMSRSAFSARFTALVGEPPMRHVARQRMRVAAQRLAEGGCTVAELAAPLGYQSEAAFSRAFKRLLGHAPGTLKRRIP